MATFLGYELALTQRATKGVAFSTISLRYEEAHLNFSSEEAPRKGRCSSRTFFHWSLPGKLEPLVRLVFIFVCLVGLALSAPQLGQRSLPDDEDTPDPYSFTIQIHDDEFTNYQSRQESQDEFGNIQGEYMWVAPDGNRYITTYSATAEGGFVSDTVKEPTDIVVKLPVPLPEFQGRNKV